MGLLLLFCWFMGLLLLLVCVCVCVCAVDIKTRDDLESTVRFMELSLLFVCVCVCAASRRSRMRCARVYV